MGSVFLFRADVNEACCLGGIGMYLPAAEYRPGGACLPESSRIPGLGNSNTRAAPYPYRSQYRRLGNLVGDALVTEAPVTMVEGLTTMTERSERVGRIKLA